MKTTVRPANPDDADFLAWAILTAARSHLPRGSWDIAIEGTEEDRLDLLRWMVLSEVPSIFQLSGFLVSTVDGRPVTALAGFDPKDPGMTTPGGALADAFGGLGWGLDALEVAFDRLHPYTKCAPQFRPGTWVIE